MLVSKGVDPIAAKLSNSGRHESMSGSFMTFGAAAEAFWQVQQSRWHNKRVREGWCGFMKHHCARIWNIPVDQVDQQLMVMVLQPLWSPHNVTARRVMHRVG